MKVLFCQSIYMINQLTQNPHFIRHVFEHCQRFNRNSKLFFTWNSLRKAYLINNKETTKRREESIPESTGVREERWRHFRKSLWAFSSHSFRIFSNSPREFPIASAWINLQWNSPPTQQINQAAKRFKLVYEVPLFVLSTYLQKFLMNPCWLS